MGDAYLDSRHRALEAELDRLRAENKGLSEAMRDVMKLKRWELQSDRDRCRAALRDLVEAHSALRPLKEQDRLIVDALDRARALLKEADRGA